MIESQDLVIIGFLIFLEGILSIDNALVLALLAKHLPKDQQKRALSYGLIGAVVFRFIAIGLAAYLIQWRWVKFVGGGYLLWLGGKHLLQKDDGTHGQSAAKRGFWKTVLIIELTDIVFAIDSILAAVALSSKFWVVFTGGILGVVLMRFAAGVFLKVLHRFPSFETTAYLLVTLIGAKVFLEGMAIPGINFHDTSSVPFWVFWGLMFACVLYGFKPKKSAASVEKMLEAETQAIEEIES